MTTRIIIPTNGRATAEGETEIFGTNGTQTVTILDGATVTFRSGFNTGGDTIRINGRASDFTASISGSNVTLRSTVDNITVIIPIGNTANTIVFDNGDSRSLSLVNGIPTLGGQSITAAGVPVTAGPGTFTITGAASVNEGGVFTYTVTRTDTSSAETLLFSVDGSTNGGIVTSATQGADFNPASGAITFAAGAATATFTVAASTDAAVEGLEGISVRVLKGSAVVAQTSGTIIDGNAQGSNLSLSTGADTVVGTGGNDIITGRISEFQSFDRVTGGAGDDLLVLTGTLPTDFQAQPSEVVDAAFAGTTGVETLILAGGTGAILGLFPIVPVNATLGTLAADSGIREVVAGGSTGIGQRFDIRAFDEALTVTGSANAETILVNLATAGAKALNLGDGADTVSVTATSGAAGSVQVNFTSAAVGNGTNNNATIVSANGNVTVNDEGTSIRNAGGNGNIFNVVGLAADGSVDLAGQNRGNFSRIELGTGAGDAFTLPFDFNANQGNVYFNLGAGNDFVRLDAEDGERHFVVMGGGNDILNVINTFDGSSVVGRLGDGDDVVVVARDTNSPPNFGFNNSGSVDIDGGAGNDFIDVTFSFFANGVANFKNDVIVGGEGRDTLAANSFDLENNFAVAPLDTVRTISGIEVIQTGGIFGTITLANIQAGIEQVNLRFPSAGTIVFDSGARRVEVGKLVDNVVRDELAGGQLVGQLTVVASGSATTDSIVIANTNGLPAAIFGGVDFNADFRDAFNNQTINANGFETVTIDTGAASVRQEIGTLGSSAAGAGGQIGGTVNFIGANSVSVDALQARNVNASGLTGTASITAQTLNGFSASVLNTFTGSSNGDTVTLGSGRQNLNLGDGNDTLIINSTANIVGGTSTLNGGGGIDTLSMSVDNAVTLSNSNPFNAGQSGFEVLSFSARQAATQTDTIRVDNLKVDRVVSLGTAPTAPAAVIGGVTIVDGIPPVAARTEQVTVSGLNGLASGESLTFSAGGVTRTITAAAGSPGTASVQRFQVDSVTDTIAGTEIYGFTIAGRSIEVRLFAGEALTAAQIAALFAEGGPSDEAGDIQYTISGTLDPAYTVAAENGVLVFTAANPGVKTQLGVTAGTNNDAGNNTIPFFVAAGSTLGTNASSGAITAAQVAQLLATGTAAFGATVVDSAAFPFNAGVVSGNSVAFETPAPGAAFAPNATVAVSAGVAPTVTINQEGVTAVTGQNETATFTFVQLVAGQSITFAGRTVTATATVSAEAVAEAFAATPGATSLTLNGIDVVGAIATGFTPARAGAVVTLTGPQANVANLTATSATREGTIVLSNMTSGDTLEIAAASTGTHQVIIIDAGQSTSDVLNLVLTNREAGPLGQNYGFVSAANVETINLVLNDAGTGGNAVATFETVNLNIGQATSLVVSGTNGGNIAHNSSALTLFDASGIVAGVGDSRADLGVTFQSLGLANRSLTVRGGIGNDDLFGSAANETYDLSRGGSDLVRFGADGAANGFDTINGFTVGTGSNADVLDLNGVFGVVGQDSNLASAASIIFNATATSGADLTLVGNNQNAYFVTDGNAFINTANIKGAIDGPTALNGEILVGDNVSAYVLHAASTGSNTFNVYRVFDSNLNGGQIVAQVQLIGTVNLTNTFGEISQSNLEQSFTAAGSTTPFTPATVPVASDPFGGSVAMLDNLGSFAVV